MTAICKDKKLSTLRLKNGAMLAIGEVPTHPNREMYRVFQVLVLTAQEYQIPSSEFPGVRVLHVPLPDDSIRGLTPEQRKQARSTARLVAAALARRQSVLVTCAMGLNRSALVASLALVALGMPRDRAVTTVRAMRSGVRPFPHNRALSNRHFTRLIETPSPSE